MSGGENRVDGVIFSKENLTLNESGALSTDAQYKHAMRRKRRADSGRRMKGIPWPPGCGIMDKKRVQHMRWIKVIGYRGAQALMDLALRLLRWREPRKIAEHGALRHIAVALRYCGAKKPLVVTGPRIVREIAPQLFCVLRREDIAYAVFCDVEVNPGIGTVERIAEKYRVCMCDCLIALGGGSPMDAAKAAAAHIARPDVPVMKLTGLWKVRRRVPPLIAIPTTAGTGSEASIAAVVTREADQRKCAIMDPNLVPQYAILDFALTKGMPPYVTAITGMDALTHAVEAYLCVANQTRKTRRLAREAVVRIAANLERAYADGADEGAREAMLCAAHQAGCAFTRTGVGYVHAIAHAVGGLYKIDHGLANAVVLPYVLEDYGRSVYKKLAQLAEAAGVQRVGNAAQKAQAFVEKIRRMNAYMQLPRTLALIEESDFGEIARRALAEANPIYPVPVVYDQRRCIRVIEKIKNGILNA